MPVGATPSGVRWVAYTCRCAPFDLRRIPSGNAHRAGRGRERGPVTNGRSYRKRIALRNTRYMAAALDHLRATEGHVVTDDVERLSPLRHDHINLHGRYYFTPSAAVARGELRVLGSVGP